MTEEQLIQEGIKLDLRAQNRKSQLRALLEATDEIMVRVRALEAELKEDTERLAEINATLRSVQKRRVN